MLISVLSSLEMTPCSLTKSTIASWWLLLLLLTTGVVEAFFVARVPTAPAAAVTPATRSPHNYYFTTANHRHLRHNKLELCSSGAGQEEGGGGGGGDGGGGGVGRRGILQTLVGSAMSMAVGDLMLNTAVTAVTGGGSSVVSGASGLYERVLSFGTKYRGVGAVASEELTAFVAAQKIAASTPEIRAWLAAQRRLQLIQKAASMATSTAAATATTRRAAGGIVEEGLMAVATTTAVKNVVSSTATNIGVNSSCATTLEAAALDRSESLLLASSNDKNLTITTAKVSTAAVTEEFTCLAASATDDTNIATDAIFSSSSSIQPDDKDQ